MVFHCIKYPQSNILRLCHSYYINNNYISQTSSLPFLLHKQSCLPICCISQIKKVVQIIQKLKNKKKLIIITETKSWSPYKYISTNAINEVNSRKESFTVKLGLHFFQNSFCSDNWNREKTRERWKRLANWPKFNCFYFSVYLTDFFFFDKKNYLKKLISHGMISFVETVDEILIGKLIQT